MANWITVTPPEPAGGYTIENNEITFSYAQNTSPTTRGAELKFTNAIAEDKNSYNPESPDGMAEFFIYQFGKREIKLSASSSDSTTPGATDCGAVTFFTDESNGATYSKVTTASMDYTSCTSGCAGRDRNLEGDWRCYNGFVNPIGFTVNMTISSTSPWLIGGTASWVGVSQYSVPTETVFDPNRQTYPGSRTYDANDVDTPVSVTLTIGANSGSTARSASLYFINKQGVVHRMDINQKGYVAPNDHPTATITNLGADSACGGGTTTLRAGYSDPNNNPVSAYIWGGIASGSTRDVSVSFPANNSCTSGATGTATLRVRDSLGDVSSTSSYQLATLPRGNNACYNDLACSVTCPAMVSDPQQQFTCTISVTSQSNNCPISYAATASAGVVVGNTITATPSIHFSGQSSATIDVTATMSNSNTPVRQATCTSNTINFAEAVSASLSFSNDGVQAAASGNVTATCDFDDPNNATPHTFSMEGDCGGNTVTSNTSTLTIPFTGLQSGTSETCTASCTATNNLNQSAMTGDQTTTISRPALTYNCNGYQDCSTVTDGSGDYSTLALCQASSCYNTQPANYQMNVFKVGSFAGRNPTISYDGPAGNATSYTFPATAYSNAPNTDHGGGLCMDVNSTDYNGTFWSSDKTQTAEVSGNPRGSCSTVSNCTAHASSGIWDTNAQNACNRSNSLYTLYTDGANPTVGTWMYAESSCTHARFGGSPFQNYGNLSLSTWRFQWVRLGDTAVRVDSNGKIDTVQACPCFPTCTLPSGFPTPGAQKCYYTFTSGQYSQASFVSGDDIADLILTPSGFPKNGLTITAKNNQSGTGVYTLTGGCTITVVKQ